MIEFKEFQQSGYRARTMENASADVTIAIAKDFYTAGEILTKNSVIKQNKRYIPINYFQAISSLQFIGISFEGKSLNVAGNGIYTLKQPQEMVDSIIYDVLKFIFECTKSRPTLIRSGGQTGIDEAGLKAAVKLGIPALCLAPKGWVFRDINHKDIADEKLFKQRFV